MALIKLVAVFGMLAVATLAQEHHIPPVEHHVEEHHYAHPKYEFKYGVKDEHTHDNKEQAEKRDGDKVEGYYKLVEPDGTIRTVHYTADKHTGFHAQVVRSGHANHPVHHEEVKGIEIAHQEAAEISAPSYTASSYSNTKHH
ncbi:cuticle protein 19-like [Cryptotermes secundus]|uniref:cuticle protein 19-like n=1 Tax=Cryptotermes secundus TaxID=105785 RepID=UPI000CD7B61D|nr:cuticle protein 19-like [Cryptotermes secundus]